jgi:preprotein translocase subunit Sec61beta
MTWINKGTWLINKDETSLNKAFKSQVIAKVTNISNIKPTWKWAGYFNQTLNIPPIGVVRVEEKINVSTTEATLFIPKLFKPNYQLKFYKADWIERLTLTIYENSMGTFNAQDNLIFPNNRATSSVANAIPPATTSTQLLAANANRKSAIFGNATDKQMIIEKAATASVAAAVIKLAPMTAAGLISYHEFDDYTGVVTAIAPSAAVGAWNVREFV